MPPQRAHQRAYLVRVALLVAFVCALHWLLARLFLRLMLASSGAGLGPRPLDLACAAVSVTLFIDLYVRLQYAGPDQVTRSLPTVLRIAPAVALSFTIPLSQPTPLVPGPPLDLIPRVLPVVAATWGGALMLAAPLRIGLHALAVRAAGLRPVDAVHALRPPTLAGAVGSLLAHATLAASLLAAGGVAARVHDWPEHTPADVTLPLLGVLALLGVALLAGASVGHSPGHDVRSIARRLDALGYNARQTLDWTVVPTSPDELGDLFTNLEHLRLRLSREVETYQQALDQTREADQAKAEFLGAVSHELRTPLNSVNGFAQLLLERELTPAQADDVRLILAGGKQLLELLTDILDISMIESGDLRLSFSPVDLGDLVEEVVDIHRPLLHGKPVSLRAETAPGLPPVVCDRRRIQQILTNLISNAIKFTETGSIEARVAYDPQRDRVLIRVSDTGVGIAPEELETIFEEYKQVGAVKRRKQGTGLGLAIARSIARHHGGTLTCESVLGEGSAFTLTLPLRPPARPTGINVTEEAVRAAERVKLRESLQGTEGGPA